MEQKKFLASDDAIFTITNEDEKKQVLDFVAKDIWSKPYIFECFVKDIPNAPLLLGQYKESFEVEQNGMNFRVPAIENTEEELEETARDIGFLLGFPKGDGYVVYPTRYTAFTTICQRAGLSGTTITNSEKRPLLAPLPLPEKAHWLSRGFSLHQANCKILYRDGKVSSMMSAEYEILPPNEVVPRMEEKLREDNPDLKFKSGMFSHEYMLLDYYLNNSEMEESFLMSLSEMGMNFSSLRAGVRFSTSDIGNSCVTAVPFYLINGDKIMLCGNKIAVSHDSGHTIDTFIDKCEELGLLFKESEDRIEELGNTDIKHPEGCFRRIIERNSKLKTGSDEIAKQLSDNFPSGCTAIDIFLAINEIIAARNAKTPLSPTTVIQLSEIISKLIFLDYKEFDKELFED